MLCGFVFAYLLTSASLRNFVYIFINLNEREILHWRLFLHDIYFCSRMCRINVIMVLFITMKMTMIFLFSLLRVIIYGNKNSI